MLAPFVLSAAIYAAPYAFNTPSVPSLPPSRESTPPTYAFIPRRKERLTRYERRHPKFTVKEKNAFLRLQSKYR